MAREQRWLCADCAPGWGTAKLYTPAYGQPDEGFPCAECGDPMGIQDPVYLVYVPDPEICPNPREDP